jgi:hypothetical protein
MYAHGMRKHAEYGAAAAVLALAFAVIVLATPYQAHYQLRALEHQRASYYLTLDVCSNAGTVAALGKHNLCDASRAIVATFVPLSAAADTLLQAVLPVVSTLPRAVWVLALIGAAACASALWNMGRPRTPYVYTRAPVCKDMA